MSAEQETDEFARMKAVVRKAQEVSTRVETQMRHLLTESSPRGTTCGRPTVLLVEDDAATRLALESWLTLNGFSVQAAASGSEAAERLDDSEGSIDVAVVDIGLPDVSGTALCEVIHQFRPRLPVVVCSGQATTEDVRRVLGAGVRWYFTKPVDPDELVAAVESALP
jgi:DNA-binding response OmpR family regulator